MILSLPTTLLAALALGVSSALATTVNISNNPNGAYQFANAAGEILPDGSLVLIGTMTDPADAGTFSAFAQTAIGSLGPFSGLAIATTATDNSPAADAFNNQPIYLWIFDTIGGVDTIGRRDNSIFTAAPGETGTADPWVFPVNAGDGSDVIAIDPFAIDLTAVTDTNTMSVGNVFGLDNEGEDISVIRLHVGWIPEPSTGLLAMLGGAALLLMRRRS